MTARLVDRNPADTRGDGTGTAQDHGPMSAIAGRLRELVAAVELQRLEVRVGEPGGPAAQDVVVLAREVFGEDVSTEQVLTLRGRLGAPGGSVMIGTLVRGACQRIEPATLAAAHPLQFDGAASRAAVLAHGADGRRWLVSVDDDGCTSVRSLADR